MREVNTHGAAGGRAWLRPSVCVRAIGTRCRRGVNRQGSEVEKMARVTPRCVRDADIQTDLHLPKWVQFCKLRIGPPKGEAGPESSGFLFAALFLRNLEIRILFALPLLH